MHLQEVERIRCIVQWRNLKQIVFLLMSSYKFYVTADQRSISIEQRQPYQRHHLKQSLSPTTIVLSPGGITLVLPFFYSFRLLRNPVVRLLERQTVMVGSHNPKQGLAGGRQASVTTPASYSNRKKEAVSQIRLS